MALPNVSERHVMNDRDREGENDEIGRRAVKDVWGMNKDEQFEQFLSSRDVY